MKIGCPKEIKPQEFRVGMTPTTASEAVRHGHTVLIQRGAGLGAGFTDADYQSAGAEIVDTAEDVFANADMIVMGAYGHSRVRERFLGGATRDMLKVADRPIFFAR